MDAGWTLIIDDDRDNCEVLSEILESAGYSAISCGSAAAADKVLDARGRPGLVLADVQLPDVTGPAFIVNMKNRPGFQDTPVIFLTGARPETLGPMVDPVLIKPFGIDALMNLVSEYCPLQRETAVLHLP